MQGRGGTHKNLDPLPSKTAGSEASMAVTRAVRPLAAARAVFATQVYRAVPSLWFLSLNHGEN